MKNNSATPSIRKLVTASQNIFWLVLWLTGLSLNLLFPLRWLFGDSLRPVRMISSITPWLLILTLPMLVTAVVSHRKWLSMVLAIASVAIVFTFTPLFLPHRQSIASSNGIPLKIMSHNLHGILEISGIVEVIRREQPDIVLIQEASPALVSPSFHGLDDLYPYLVTDPKGFGQAILSRYPLEQTGSEFKTGKTLKVSVETTAGRFALWNTHPIPPFLVPPEQYDEQISALAAEISRASGPLIVGGDFNATDQTEAYRKIHQYLADSYQETGNGFGFTYPAPPYTFMDSALQTGPLWRIDYIFHSREFTAIWASRLTTSGGSDHFPILVELSLNK